MKPLALFILTLILAALLHGCVATAPIKTATKGVKTGAKVITKTGKAVVP